MHKIVMKGTREVMHHLFKLRPAVLKRNISWKWKMPSLVDIEHAHIYHSVDGETLEENQYCAPVGGHFHEVKVSYDEDGNIKGVKCGPPLQKVFTKIPGHDNGGIWSIEQVEFERPEVLEKAPKGGGRWKDDHTHEVQYIDSELLTSKANIEYRERARQQLHGAMKGHSDGQAEKALAMQENAIKVSKHVKEVG